MGLFTLFLVLAQVIAKFIHTVLEQRIVWYRHCQDVQTIKFTAGNNNFAHSCFVKKVIFMYMLYHAFQGSMQKHSGYSLVWSRQSIAHHTHPEKCAPYIHFSCTNTNGFIQGNMLNTPQAVPLICKASVVQSLLFSWVR